MITETITFTKEDKYLSDALNRVGHQLLPSDRVINKTLTGIGATYMEIKAKRNSIIIEPNVPVIIGKLETHPECLGVYKGGSTDIALKKYLQNPDIKYKKLLTTPESFYRIRDLATELCIDIYTGYFCLFDECEKIGQDYEFRESIAFPIADFFKFNTKAFISATPLKTLNRELTKLNFHELIIKPDFNYKIDLELITTNVFKSTVKEKIQSLLDNNSTCICIFFNSIRGIKLIIEQFNISADKYTIFCSDSRHNELRTEDFHVEDKVDNSTVKHINFFTSRYYSAVDFNLSVAPDIILITNIQIATHSRIDPFSEAIQIQGRFRNIQPDGKRINSMCHITDLVITKYLTPDDINITFKQWLLTAQNLKQRHMNTQSALEETAILTEYQNCMIFPYLITPNFQTDFEMNIFGVLNVLYKERVKSVYCSTNNLIQAYNDSNYFNLTHTDKFDSTFTFNDIDLPHRFTNKKTAQKEQISSILKQLKLGVSADQILVLLKEIATADQYVNASCVIELQKLVGTNKVSNLKTFKAVSKLLQTTILANQYAEARMSKEVIEDIVREFSPDFKTPIQKKDIQNRLQIIFDKHKLLKTNNKPFKVSQDTIIQYFDNYTEDKRTDKNTYTLISIKPELFEKISSSIII